MVRSTDRPAMTIAVDFGRKANNQPNQPCTSRAKKREHLSLMKGGGGWGTLLFSYIHRLGSFLGSKFLISLFFFGEGGGGSEK